MAKAQTPKKAKKAKKVSYHKQPEDLSIRDWQLALRRQFGQAQVFKLENQGKHPVWSDFAVRNPDSRSSYRVAIRGLEPGDNFCSCYDFRTNQLGTCKHIEWTLEKLKNTWGNKQHFKKGPLGPQPYSSLSVDYATGEPVLRLRIGSTQRDKFTQLAAGFFADDGSILPSAWLAIDQFVEAANALDEGFRCYPDALDLIIERREDARRQQKAAGIAADPRRLDQAISATLYPYQREGALFAFRAGRALIADEMGLGKTLQAITAAELFRQEMGISSVYIVCPTSLKYQWQSEIRKFTNSSVTVIEGPQPQRRLQYADPAHFYKILTYNVVARDFTYLNDQLPDLLILDEAQRIKNYDSKIAHAVKKLEAPNRIALTGTPLENKLEDLYSIVQFLDQYRLGPLWKLHARHVATDEQGVVRGYRYLEEINAKLATLMIRRRKKEVAQQLPPRVDQHFLVPMTAAQMEMHEGYNMDVALLVAKWRRMGFLNEKDRQRLMNCLTLMRMTCNSTYLVDQQTRHDTKIAELFFLLEERLADPQEKVVIFSQWERMTRIVGQELEARSIDYAYLHGGIPSEDRGALLDRFREDDACRVFLSTDAGGVGLNLQRAALIVNLDLPWNPAVLEQRIGRVHRLGQERGVQVINLISEGTIEHRMVHTLRFKSQLAEAVLDTGQDNVFMSDRKFNDFMENLERVQDAPVTATPGEPVSDDDLENPVGQAAGQSGDSAAPDWQTEAEDGQDSKSPDQPSHVPPNKGSSGTEAGQPSPAPAGQAPAGSNASDGAAPAESAASLVSEGVGFLERLTRTLSDANATQDLVNSITETDTATGKTYLKIPVDSQATVSNALRLLGGLLKG
ncbi:SNF2-related protein [Neolewinella lacunae]|uniref:DEAD/DEAH box helicase family protein n=1 Tax=Neolewinella lacunae TaxID=1517758 RepID=A0A923T8H8_9BACT|nr:SNF2-related protein [Neolewinella lacunae]MBC6993973.1 DEAD/DEAH box helicase family protein [Neolewinella lacunae]MDN3635512.1 SNF2-related protein [Neolewinella lacunae]